VFLSGRLVDEARDRAVGVAFVRAVIRTINTYLADDYQSDDDVVAALAEATGQEEDEITATPEWIFDWELRRDTTGRIQTVLLELGGVLYEEELPESDLVDRSLYRDAVGA
jgi:NitT/TauT family transport system substrate-binding protein